MNAQVSGGEYETVSLNGATVSARHFTVVAHNRDDVWLDNRGIPVMFRAVEDGTHIDFVLQTAPQPGWPRKCTTSWRSMNSSWARVRMRLRSGECKRRRENPSLKRPGCPVAPE